MSDVEDFANRIIAYLDTSVTPWPDWRIAVREAMRLVFTEASAETRRILS